IRLGSRQRYLGKLRSLWRFRRFLLWRWSCFLGFVSLGIRRRLILQHVIEQLSQILVRRVLLRLVRLLLDLLRLRLRRRCVLLFRFFFFRLLGLVGNHLRLLRLRRLGRFALRLRRGRRRWRRCCRLLLDRRRRRRIRFRWLLLLDLGRVGALLH